MSQRTRPFVALATRIGRGLRPEKRESKPLRDGEQKNGGTAPGKRRAPDWRDSICIEPLCAYDRIPRPFMRELRPLVRQISSAAGDLQLEKSNYQRGLVVARFRIGARLGAAMHEACQTRFVSESAATTRNERQETVSIRRQGALDLPSTYQRASEDSGVVITRQSLSRKLDY